MAFISYVSEEDIPPADRVSDHDNILRIHGVHSRIMKQHYDLYLELMRARGPLSRAQREMIAVVVSLRMAVVTEYSITERGSVGLSRPRRSLKPNRRTFSRLWRPITPQRISTRAIERCSTTPSN